MRKTPFPRLSTLVPGLLLVGAAVACGSSGGSGASGFVPPASGDTPGQSEGASSDPSGDNTGGPAGDFGGADTDAGSSCKTVEQKFPVKADPSNVMILLDRSGSMQIRLTAAAGGGTRWTATRDALKGLLTQLPPQTRAAAMMFPQGDTSVEKCCGITAANLVHCAFTSACVEPPAAQRCAPGTYEPGVGLGDLDAAHAAEINAYVAASDAEFYFGTPTGPALAGAVQSMRAANVEGAKSVILLTDGYPASCGTDEADAQSAIAAAATGSLNLSSGEKPVRTYVVAVLDGDNGARADLASKIAKAGGTPRTAGCEATNSCFYPVNESNFEEEIASTFQQISTATFDCSFTLPPAAAGTVRDPSKVNVQITGNGKGEVVPRDPGRKGGWDYSTSDNGKIQLYGDSCDALKADSTKAVEIVIGCTTQVK